MRRDRRPAGDDSGGNTMGWLTTFNDLITLLMVFFVLIFAMSSPNVDEIAAARHALQTGLGILLEGSAGAPGVAPPPPVITPVPPESPPRNDSRRDLRDTLAAVDPDNTLQATLTGNRVQISLADTILFAPGSAQIHPEGYTVLNRVRALVERTPWPVRVEGHTDDRAIHTPRFPSNWELSTARAVNVVKYLARSDRIDPGRLSAVGYGESKPLVRNDTPAHRARNRRVEIVLETDAPPGTQPDTQNG